MKNIAAQLESYCKEHPVHMDGRENILESLYWLYAESVPTDSKKLRDGYSKLREHLHFLKPKEYDAVFDIVTELCTESEQIAFYAGVRLGTARMFTIYFAVPPLKSARMLLRVDFFYRRVQPT